VLPDADIHREWNVQPGNPFHFFPHSVTHTFRIAARRLEH
jgi:hypothetical protein